MRYANALLCATFLLSGCADRIASPEKASKHAGDALAMRLPSSFSAPHRSGDVENDWISAFGDKALIKLVDEGMRYNPDLKQAAARVERAAALTALTRSGALPQAGISGFYHDNNNAGADEVAFGGVGISWEPDVWGRIANATAASYARTFSAAADYYYARQSLAGRIARTWFELNAAEAIYHFNKRIVTLQKKSAEILKKREEIGQGTLRDVHLANALVATAQDAAVAAKEKKERTARALEILIGRYPSATLRAGRLLHRLPPVPAGLPAEILARRPDIVAAQARVAAAFHDVEAAKMLKLPSVRLKLGAGPNTLNDAVTSLAAGIFAPLYTGGAIEARIARANAEQQAAVAAYAKTVLRALREVEDALASDAYLSRRYRYANKAVREYKAAYEMSLQNYRIGKATLMDVLIVQGKWIRAEITRLTIAKARLDNRVRLYLALGGDFEIPDANRTKAK